MSLTTSKGNITLQEACSKLGLKEHELLNLFSPAKILKKQIRNAEANLLKRKNQLIKEKAAITLEEGKVGLEGLRMQVEVKELSLKNVHLDKQLANETGDKHQAIAETAGLVFDTLHIQPETTEAERQINHYLKDKWPIALERLGIVPEKQLEPEEGKIMTMDKRILGPDGLPVEQK